MNLQKRIWEISEAAEKGDTPSRIFDVFILFLIFSNVVAVMIGSVSSVMDKWGFYLTIFETVSVSIFTIEYIARLWSCTTDEGFKGDFKGRLRFAFKGMSIIDLLAILPFYLSFVGLDLRSIRVLRMLRILRVAKVGRYYNSLALIKRVLRSKKEELVLTSVLLGMLLVVSSSILFYCENSVQPESFSSIPATMWWSVATLTTVGYGDMYPVTLMGRLFASVIAVLGIGMFALPTGILGAGFVEEIQNSKSTKVCPHCGEHVD